MNIFTGIWDRAISSSRVQQMLRSYTGLTRSSSYCSKNAFCFQTTVSLPGTLGTGKNRLNPEVCLSSPSSLYSSAVGHGAMGRFCSGPNQGAQIDGKDNTALRLSWNCLPSKGIRGGRFVLLASSLSSKIFSMRFLASWALSSANAAVCSRNSAKV